MKERYCLSLPKLYLNYLLQLSSMRNGLLVTEYISWFVFTIIRPAGFVEHFLLGNEMGLPSGLLDIALIQFEIEHVLKFTK